MRTSIFFRLMMGYLLLLMLTMGVSLYSISKLGRVRDVTHSVILEDNVLLDLNKSLTNTLLTETLQEKKFIILHDQVYYNGFLQAWRDFDKYLASARGLARSPELSAMIDRIGTLH